MRPMLPRLRPLLVLLLGLIPLVPVAAQVPEGRISFNDQALFLSGSNVAWINFARDIGPGATDLETFDEIFAELHASGGNSMRLWLHTTGEATPEWDGHRVVGPGEGAIEDLRAILDLAWKHEVGLMLCLWSFDMMRSNLPQAVRDRSRTILTDPAMTQTYIDHALVPMVEALAGHPAIIAWEIFNEPEGMSDEFGWGHTQHVPMAAIQQFINLTAGAIHRADPDAQVTNGSWSFSASSDMLTGPNEKNYYDDAELIAAGGDPDGTLDFYTVHYYEWGGTRLSPFHNSYAHWGLDKPLVVAEFFMGGGDDGQPDTVYGISYQNLYQILHDRGYAGALGWQWFNYPVSAEGVVNWPRMLANMETLYALYPEAVDVLPGLRITAFIAEPPGIEAGQASTLSWIVSGASTITLDGQAVDSVGTMIVAPAETTTYTLEAVARADGEVQTAEVTVEVLDPDEVNRARMQPAVASTEETCCGNDAGASLAVDGDANTRWSSEWQAGFADDDPDDEWIQVDLGQAFDLARVVLDWEAAYGVAYDLDVSYDGRIWQTVHEERGGDGGTDEIVFDVPPSGRYLRMRGLERATPWGYSLWEVEVYGLPSSQQPPTVALTAPIEGAVVAPGSNVTLTASAADPDGAVQQVAFYVDGEAIGTATEAPFSVVWEDVPDVEFDIEFEVTAIATDDDGIAVTSEPVPVFALNTDSYTRYEAEEATFTGEVTRATSMAASSRQYLDMRDSGTITFEVPIDAVGEYLLTIRYNLAYDTPKSQFIVVNGDTLTELRFSGPTNTWLERGVRVYLQDRVAYPGYTNTVAIHKSWGWMQFDYVDVQGRALRVGAEEDGLPDGFALGPNYPNPFNPSTVIPFALDAAAAVRLEVFDAMGRRVATLVDGHRAPGTYEVRFDGRGHASGVYFVRLQAGAQVQTNQMLLLK